MKEIKTTSKYKKIIKNTLIGLMFILSVAYVFHELKEHYHYKCVASYSFINPIFACSEQHIIDKREYRDLRVKLVDFIYEQKASDNASVISVFFRDLEAGPTMGINDRVDFIPASLLKLPNAILLLRLQEEGEVDLKKQTMSYSDIRHASGESLRTDRDILPNTSYTLETLIERSMIYSDNLANRLIIKYIDSVDGGRNLSRQIYRDLGILEVHDTITSAVNTKGYGSIFRMLYNVSFLNNESSEKLLDIMSRSVSIGGLVTGVPSNIKISHKFGERVLDSGEKQLHDCGIIYYPENPYLLCVMTRGRNIEKLEKIISYISTEVYKEVDSRKLK